MKYKQWVAEVYADSPDLFQAHIVHQLKRACELINDDFIFIFTMQDESLSSLVSNPFFFLASIVEYFF